jgi:hypothetical protein
VKACCPGGEYDGARGIDGGVIKLPLICGAPKLIGLNGAIGALGRN